MDVSIELKLLQNKKTGKYTAECPLKCGWSTEAFLKKEALSRALAHLNAQHRSSRVGSA